MRLTPWALGLTSLFLVTSTSAETTAQPAATKAPGTQRELVYREEQVRALTGITASYLDEYTQAGAAHPHLPHRLIEMRGGAPLTHTLGDHLLYLITREEKIALVVDGKEGPLCQEVLDPRIGPDGTTINYRFRRDGKMFLNINARELGGYDYLDMPVFSPDGKHMAYGAMKAGKWLIVADGQEGPSFDDVNSPRAVINDQGRLAYGAYVDGKWHQIIDGKPALVGIGIGTFFGARGEHMAYLAYGQNSAACVVVDGVPGKEYPSILYDRFTVVDDKQIAFVSPLGTSSFRQTYVGVVNGREFALGYSSTLVFSQDQRHWACVEQTDDHSAYVLRDGIQVATRESAANLEFSPSGAHFAFVGRAGNKSAVYVDGKYQPEYDLIDTYPYHLFSAMGNHLVYIAHQGTHQYLVVDGKQGPEEDDIAQPLVSPDGRYAYIATIDRNTPRPKACLVVDGIKGPPYDSIPMHPVPNTPGSWACAAFSPDGKHVAYGAVINAAPDHPARNIVVLDGKEVDPATGPWSDRLNFRPFPPEQPTQFYFTRDGFLYRGIWE